MFFVKLLYDFVVSINSVVDPIVNVVSLTISGLTLFFSIRIKSKVYKAVEEERAKIRKNELLNTIQKFKEVLNSNGELSSTFCLNLREFSIQIQCRYPLFAKDNHKHLSILHSAVDSNTRNKSNLLDALTYLYYGFERM